MSTAAEMLKADLEQDSKTFAYLAENLAKKAAKLHIAEPVLQTILDVKGLPEAYVSFHEDHLSITYYNAKSFKAFEAVFLALEPLGYSVAGWGSEKSDTRVTYRNKDKEYYIRLDVSPDNSLCERVQVGTETREVPIYEIRCKEDAPAEETAEVSA